MTALNDTKEIRLHSRGGMGLALMTQMVVAAFGMEGKYAAGLPSFGIERRGSPVTGYVRVSNKPIREKCRVYAPECLVIMDSRQLGLANTMSGLKPEALLVLDAKEMPAQEALEKFGTIALVDATGIALEEIGRPITNTCILGALAGCTGWLEIGSIVKALERYFPPKLLGGNQRCAERGFAEVQMKSLNASKEA